MSGDFVISSQRSATARCTAIPPPSVIFRCEKSSEAKPGVCMRALKSVFTPVIAEKRCLPSSATKPGMSRGLGIRTFLAPNFMKVRQFPVSAKMWYSGRAVMTISRPSSRPVPTQLDTCWRLATRFPWVSIAPFDTPVVPPVYCRKAMSLVAERRRRQAVRAAGRERVRERAPRPAG